MVAGIKSIQGNIICASCENAAQTALQESSAMQAQMEKLQKKLRAQVTDAEKRRLEAEQQIAALTQQCHQGQSSTEYDRIMADCDEMRATHEATQLEMGTKYKALVAQFKKYKDKWR